MPWYYNLALIFIFIIAATYLVIHTRKRLLKLWKDVTNNEVLFYRRMESVVRLFYKHKEELQDEDNKEFYRTISRYRKKKIRALLLQTRQDLYNSLVNVYTCIEESEEEQYQNLKKSFNQLQKIRRIYNSKVLIYNQTISVFPTRYIALRMKLELKEYFG